MPTLHIRKQTINQNAYQYTRVQDRNTGMALTAYLMSRLLFLLHAVISFHFLSCLCVCYYICLYFGKAAFHGCPIKCLSLSLSLFPVWRHSYILACSSRANHVIHLAGRGPTKLRAWVRNRDRLENRSHVVPKTEFQDGGGRTRMFTHKINILA